LLGKKKFKGLVLGRVSKKKKKNNIIDGRWLKEYIRLAYIPKPKCGKETQSISMLQVPIIDNLLVNDDEKKDGCNVIL
jgi:hypothetical protein